MRSERDAMVAGFLGAAGWGGAARAPLAGDASGRRYERLRLDSETRVLMDVGDDVAGLARFVAVGEHLAGCGLSAPRVFAEDRAAGLLLIEDFGGGRYPELLARDPGRERALFVAATEVLGALHAHPAPAAPDLGAVVLTEQAGLVYDSYLPAVTGRDGASAKREMQAVLAEAFTALPDWSPVLALRDYHAGNLFWLEGRAGPAKVGLIDFQDAGLGHPLYDLVSLARDARRDVHAGTVAAMQLCYSRVTGIEPGAAWPLLAVQRNLRILGIFARLALVFGKPAYLDYMPRTWALMVEDLDHVSLSRLKTCLLRDLPPPTPEIIARLKARCPTAPTA